MSNYKISEDGLALIKRFEGYSATPYRCPAGKLTIGYGHVVKEDEVYLQREIDINIAEILLKQDVGVAERKINDLVVVPLRQGQFDALVSLTYNVGIYAFEKSTLLRLLNAKNYEKAALEFNRWVYAKGKKMKGLIERRRDEQELFLCKTGFFTKL